MPRTFSGIAVAFASAFILAIIFPSFFSRVEINFFVAPLIFSFYILSKTQVTWLALLSGCFLDCLNVLPRLGFTGFSFLSAALLLFPQRHYFFKDSSSTLPIMTYLFSALSSMIQGLIASLFDLPAPPLLGAWLFTDCLLMPLLDSFFALLFFSLPCYLYKRYYQQAKVEPYAS